MEKSSKNTAPPEVADPNAAIGSCPERPVQPSDNEIQAFGITNDVGAAEALQSLAVGFTLEGVQKTKGAVSNKEMEEFAKIGPSLGKSPEGIALIIEMRRTLNQRAVEVAGIARKYLKQNGTMAGFGDVLDRFHQENPLFTEELRGKISRLQQVGGTGAAGTGTLSPGADALIRQHSPEAIKREYEKRFGNGR